MIYIAVILLIVVFCILFNLKEEQAERFMYLQMRISTLEKAINDLKKILQESTFSTENAEKTLSAKEEKMDETVKPSSPIKCGADCQRELKEAENLVEQSLKTDIPTIKLATQDMPMVEKTNPFVSEKNGVEVGHVPLNGMVDTPETSPETLLRHQVSDKHMKTPVVEDTSQHEKAFDIQGKKFDYETFIGENLFGKIGILIFVVGIGFFVKYAIDQNWISEMMRTLFGFAIGGGMLALAYRLKSSYRAFSSLLAGGGCAVFYVTVAIAFHYYHIFSSVLAFIILVVVTVFMVSVSLFYDRRELATMALVGGFLAPFIASTGEGNYNLLLLYIGILNIGMAVLALYRRWSELPLCCFLFTATILFFFEYPLESTQNTTRLIFGLFFCVLMTFTAFYLLKHEKVVSMRMLLYSLLLLNAFFCLYNTSETAWFLGYRTGYCCLFLAFLHFVLCFLSQKEDAEHSELHEFLLALSVTFVTLSIPMFFEGDILRLFWAVEMVMLLWLYVRSENRIYAYASAAIVAVTTLSVVYTFTDFTYGQTTMQALGAYLTWLVTGLAYIVFAYLMQRHRPIVESMYSPWNALMYIVGVFVIYYYSCIFIDVLPLPDYNTEAILLFSSLYLLLVACLSKSRFDMNSSYQVWAVWLSLHVLIYFLYLWWDSPAYNQWGVSFLSWSVIAVLAMDIVYIAKRYCREMENPKRNFTVFIGLLSTALWLTAVKLLLLHFSVSDFSAGMSLGLSIAAFVQMSWGMKTRCKDLRLLSIALFSFVLVKLILNDVWQMSALWRIIVFIILGLLLLVLSFLYQRLKNVVLKDDGEAMKEEETACESD